MDTAPRQEVAADPLRPPFPFWDELTTLQKEALSGSSTLRAFPRGAHVHGGSNDCIGVLFVIKGTLRASLLAESGREISLFRIEEEESCVLSASCILPLITFDIFIDAQTDAEVLVVSPTAFSSLMQANPSVEAYAYRQTAERFSDVMWVFNQVLFVSFDRRLAAYLLEETRPGNPRVLERTHESMARDLGSAREVVSRMLNYFQEEGLVTLSRGSVALLDEGRLSRLAYRR